MKPVVARFLRKDCLSSAKRTLHVLEFEVKFQDGQIESLELEMDENYQEIIRAKLSRASTFYTELEATNTWQIDLLTSWKEGGDVPEENALYQFTDLTNDHFRCERKHCEFLNPHFRKNSAVSFFPRDKNEPSRFEKADSSRMDWKMSACEMIAWFCFPIVGWAYLAYYAICTTCYSTADEVPKIDQYSYS
ncbi:MAG: hypothetical protein H0U73_11805 [Tatlockia sp.]|nr:hypothetical protein [Tatlockia sp.]